MNFCDNRIRLSMKFCFGNHILDIFFGPMDVSKSKEERKVRILNRSEEFNSEELKDVLHISQNDVKLLEFRMHVQFSDNNVL